jgi:hypothetical protein
VRWSDDDDGYLELWKDGESVFRREGLNAFNDMLGPYLKIGLYISDWTRRYREPGSGHERRSLYFDAVEVVKNDLLLPGAAASEMPWGWRVRCLPAWITPVLCGGR